MIAQSIPLKLTDLVGVGPKTSLKLTRLKIQNPQDLLFHLPLKYLDFSQPSPISQLQPGTTACLKGQFINLYLQGKTLKAKFKDSSGTLSVVWFNQPYLKYQLRLHTPLLIRGPATSFKGQLQLVNPQILPLTSAPIVPVYPQVKGLKTGWSQRLITQNFSTLCQSLPETLPSSILNQFSLPSTAQALSWVHFPQTTAQARLGRRRLNLNELLAYLAQNHRLSQTQLAIKPTFRIKPLSATKKQLFTLLSRLPFQPTPSQTQAIEHILNDLASAHVSNRLLTGDVGSGKSLVIFTALVYTYLSGHSSCLVAPTKILCLQHYQNFQTLFPGINLNLVTSQKPIKPSSTPTVYIGTQALLKPTTLKPAVVIFDEQHRFGVVQRGFFSDAQSSPHLITVSATPIPRSLQLTLLSHLKVSRLDRRPTQKPAKTFLLTPQKEADFYSWLTGVVSPTNQAFIVCPHIQSSEIDNPVSAAQEEYNHFTHSYPNIPTGLIHAALKPSQIEAVLADFKAGKTLVLIATPIIEVGIDIPNAAIMLIKSAHRFGLAQLHQLRGRVGRGSVPGNCFLSAPKASSSAQNRLEYFCSHTQGDLIAEYDLKIRGPGQFLSPKQHGFISSLLLAESDPQTYLLAQDVFKLISSNPNLVDTLAHHPSVNYTILS